MVWKQHYFKISQTSFVCTQWFQVLLSNTYNSTWPIDGSQIGTTIPGQRWPGSNGSEGVFHISQSSGTGASPSDGLVSYLGHLFRGGVTPLQKCIE